MRRKDNKLIYYVIALLVLGISLGYAFLFTDLAITGATSVASSSWDVYWDNIVLGDHNVDTVTSEATISNDLTEVSFSVNVGLPGDVYEFTVDAVNDGSIDAMVNIISEEIFESDGVTPAQMPSYLGYTFTYIDGVAIEQNHLLAAGETERYKIGVYFKEDIDPSDLPDVN